VALAPGTRLGGCEILSLVGKGGMGEVYRARDTRLGRDVAVKVLLEAVARDPERLARFEREAHLLASLNHPNIAAIYGFEQSGGVPFLVLEYVPGETLRGPLPLDDAVAIARQIADALEAAHEKTIVHRDLKPANIKITPEGKVKVLDFGLAKALADDPASTQGSQSPTISVLATRAGVILGTAAYMSPEQVRGRAVDKRADVWAFGCVLYELLAGRQAFACDTVSDTLAAILGRDADWNALPAGLPSGVLRLLRRCLQRDRDRRLRDIADARLELEESPTEPLRPVTAPSRSRLGWIAATAVATVALLALAVIHFRETPPAAPTTRFLVLPPDKATFSEYPTISPDGRRLAFVATVDGKALLWVRPLDSLAAQPLAGTEEAEFPFWSPDSRFLAFASQGKLKKVDVSGGPPQTLCNAGNPFRGGAWGRDGTVVFNGGGRAPLRRVPAAGGVPAPLTTVDSPGELSHRWPHFLPDGRHFLYWIQAVDRQRSAVVLASLDDQPDSKERRRLLSGVSMAAYSAGHLLFEREGTLLAQPFDASRFQVRGEPFPAVQQVGQTSGIQGWAAFSVSSEGTLASRAGGGAKTQLAWFDRAGKETGRLGQPEHQADPRISPDQKRVAVTRRDPQGLNDIWLLEPARDTSTRFTFQAVDDHSPVWSPDGSRVAFASLREVSHVYQKLSGGGVAEELLVKSSDRVYLTDWSADGRFLLYQAIGPKGPDLWALPLEGDRKPIPVAQTEFSELHGQFSPDGRWVAYESNESTPPQVYVQAFPKAGGKFQVSTNGGFRARWRHDGKELYYMTPGRKLMAVEVKATATSFEALRPRELFQSREANVSPLYATYDVTADGQRFLINAVLEAEGPPPITVVMNWVRPN